MKPEFRLICICLSPTLTSMMSEAELTQPLTGYIYTRRNNPTNARFAKVVAHLEGADIGVTFASGVGAIATTLMALTQGGDHIIAQTH